MKEFTSRDVIFIEDAFPFHPGSSNEYMNHLPISMPQSHSKLSDDFLFIDPFELHQSAVTSTSPLTHSLQQSAESFQHTTLSPISLHGSTTVTLRRSSRHHAAPQWYKYYLTNNASSAVSAITNTTVLPNFYCFLSVLSKSQDPLFFKQAVQHFH